MEAARPYLRELAQAERELGEAADQAALADAVLRMREARAEPLRRRIAELSGEER